MKKLLIFAGTSEGRFLIESIIGKAHIISTTATTYGRDLLPPDRENFKVLDGRLTLDEMVNLMKQENFDAVIDTTHPYAQIVTENIKSSCKETNTRYIRFLRTRQEYEGVIRVKSIEDAVKFIDDVDGNVLLTVGSKELKKFTAVKDFENKLFPRVLPMESVLSQCVEYGYRGKNIICMQGPFSVSMNEAIIDHTNAKLLVTKDTGKAGGFEEKVISAQNKNIKVLVIDRPTEEKGFNMYELLEFMNVEWNFDISQDILEKAKDIDGNLKNTNNQVDKNYKIVNLNDKSDWFPLFSNIKDKAILIVGMGKIGFRRLKTLNQFSSNIKVVSLSIDKEVKKYLDDFNINYEERQFVDTDIDNKDIVLIATDDRDINKKIVNICKAKNILVNSSENKEDCDFYFPAICIKDDIVVGLTAQGKNHKLAKDTIVKIREALK